MWQWLHKFASFPTYYRWSSAIIPWCGLITIALAVVGLVWGLAYAPPDYQQGDAFRIIYVHVPAAFMSMGVYTYMAILSFIYLVWKIKLADVLASQCAVIGISFTALALVTGSVWGKPMWGTWWQWDARMTSELILLFQYIALVGIRGAIENEKVASKSSSILAIIGFVNIPIIHYSVYWWNSLHQGATISKLEKPSMAPDMLYPLLIMILAFGFYFLWILLLRGRTEAVKRESTKQWVKDALRTKM